MIELTEYEAKQIKKITEITLTDYDIKEIDDLFYIKTENLINALTDLKYEYGELEEELEDLKYDIEENYQPKKVDLYDYYGVSESDFH